MEKRFLLYKGAILAFKWAKMAGGLYALEVWENGPC
jgi:hypothetical protein